MRELWLYHAVSRFGRLNYRAKIMIMAFIGTHIPLIALISFFALRSGATWQAALATIGVALLATLAGTGITLFVLNHLLRPVLMTSRALKAYRVSREILPLPTSYTDEVGTLMADAGATLTHLEAIRHRLESMDATTGLPNRRRFEELVGERLDGAAFAVCVVKFANLSKIAATFDHQTAEDACRQLAERLAAVLDPTGDLARIEPDTFAFTIQEDAEGAPDPARAASAVGRLRAACSAKLDGKAAGIIPALQAGLALLPDDGSQADVLVDLAAAAAALASDVAPVVFHSPKARAAAIERFTLEQELTRALARDEFTLHYQPIIDLSVGRAIGAEALIRWQHPERGLVPPGHFIPLAEASGLIDPMGLWVMRQACRQLSDWTAAGLTDITVAINLSARQFLDRSLVSQIEEALAAHRVSPRQLEIELTETVAMVDHDYTKRAFGKLRDLGVSVSIDDFGTGYASMSYLRKLPFDKLKIDREFVSDVDQQRGSQAICNAIVELARGLDLKVLAEGTEREAEVMHLRDRGCQLFQGYFFSKPVPASALPSAIVNVAATQMALKAA